MSLPPPPPPCVRGPMVLSSVDYPIQHYVYPCQLSFLLVACFFGVRTLRYSNERLVARGSVLLLAVADFCLLLTMLPQSLATFQWFYQNETCRRFVHFSKITVNAWSNVFSACEVFLTTAVIAECFLRATGSSLVKWFVPGPRYAIMMTSLALTSIALTSYHFFLYDLITGFHCGGTKLVSKLTLGTIFTPTTVRTLNVVQAVTVILIPCLLVYYCNRSLVRILKQGKLPLVDTECQQLFGSTENITVCKRQSILLTEAITVAFVLSHVLSFVPFLYDFFPSLYLVEWFPHIITIINSCLVSGKLATLILIFKNCRQLSKTGFY